MVFGIPLIDREF